MLAFMKTNYSTIFILLYLIHISYSNISITKLLLMYGSNIDNTVCEISRIITAIENNSFSKPSFIKIVLPAGDDSTIMPQLMEKTAQKLGTRWLVNIYDGFCCDSHEPRVVVTQKPMTIEYTPDFYIIPLRKNDGLNYLDAQLNLMSEYNSFNPRAIFLLVTLTHQCGDYKDKNSTVQYFNKMWGNNCMSSVILFLSVCDFNITIITATPFSDSNICRTVQDNGTKHYNSKSLKEEIDIGIYKSDVKNFNKCTFSVGTIPSPPYVVGKPDTNANNKTSYEFVRGIDLEILRLGSTVHNYTYVFDVKHGYNSDALVKWLPNGTTVGIFVDLLQKKLDIAVGGIIPHPYNYYRYDYSYYYKFSSVCWVVSDASLAPRWKIFFGAFSQDVWIISGVVFLMLSILYSFLDRCVKYCPVGNRHNCIKNICLYCNFQTMPLLQYLSVTLGLSSMLMPKSHSLRLLYFSWNIYSMHMCIAYSSMLFLLITNPPLQNEIKTVEDLSNSGFKVGSNFIVFKRFALANLDITTKNILEDHFVCPIWKACIEDLIKHRNFSILIRQDMLEYYINTKQSKVHRISFLSYGASVMTSKGNPLYPGFEKLILLAIQSGLVEKWVRDTKSEFQSVNVKDGLKGSEKSATILTVSDFKETFFVLLSGIIISSLLLIGELVISYLRK